MKVALLTIMSGIIISICVWVFTGIISIPVVNAKVDSNKEILKTIQADVLIIKNHLIGE